MASMNLKYQGTALACLVLGVGRIRKHYEGGERTDKDELLNGKPLYRYPAAFSSDGITCMGWAHWTPLPSLRLQHLASCIVVFQASKLKCPFLRTVSTMSV